MPARMCIEWQRPGGVLRSHQASSRQCPLQGPRETADEKNIAQELSCCTAGEPVLWPERQDIPSPVVQPPAACLAAAKQAEDTACWSITCKGGRRQASRLCHCRSSWALCRCLCRQQQDSGQPTAQLPSWVKSWWISNMQQTASAWSLPGRLVSGTVPRRL
jgi:hypothetical protein